MALATTCPRCQTGFRVVPDQLKIRRGLVRCGACRHVFSGLDSLRYVNEQTDLAAAPSAEGPAGSGSSQPRDLPAGGLGAGAALNAERLAAAYGRDEPDLPGATHAPQADRTPGAPGPARPSDPELRAALARAAMDDDLTDGIGFAPSHPDGAASPDAAQEPPPTAAPAPDPVTLDAVADADADAALGQSALVGAAPRRPSPAGSLDRPTDLVVLEGLDDLDDLSTLSLPDYLSEPEVPAETPPDTPSPEAFGDDTPQERVGNAGSSPREEPVSEPSRSGRDQPTDQAAEASASHASPVGHDGQAPTDAGGAARDRAWIAEPEPEPEPMQGSAPSPVSDAATEPRAGEAPEAWSAALLAPDPSARRARAGDGGAPEAVDFFATAAHAGGFTSRRSLMSVVLCVALALTLTLQLTLAGRDWLASRIPALEPALSLLCGLVGLTIQAPRELDSLTLESFDVQTGASADALVMDLLMRNRASHPVRWPAIEMSLSDAAGVLLVRKVVLPADYLGPATPAAGAPPNQETALRLALQAAGFAPAGFSLKLFYP